MIKNFFIISIICIAALSNSALAAFHQDEYGRPSSDTNTQGGGGPLAPTNTTRGGGGPITSDPQELPNPIGTTSFVKLLERIAGFLLIIAVPIATIIIIYGAFLIMTAGGVPGNLEKGKKAILYAVIGLAIMFLFRVIMALLAQLLGTTLNI